MFLPKKNFFHRILGISFISVEAVFELTTLQIMQPQYLGMTYQPTYLPSTYQPTFNLPTYLPTFQPTNLPTTVKG